MSVGIVTAQMRMAPCAAILRAVLIEKVVSVA